jgi:hypothetical protein
VLDNHAGAKLCCLDAAHVLLRTRIAGLDRSLVKSSEFRKFLQAAS